MTDYEYYKSHGICVCCRHRDALPNKTYCAECIVVVRKRSLAHRNRLKAGGICVQCGKRPVWREGASVCPECRDRYNTQRRESYAQLAAAGICVKCRKEPAIPNRVLCPTCTAHKAEQDRRRNERRANHAD